VEKKVDAGTFAITVGGRRAGRETFEIVQTGLSLEVRTRSTIDLPAGQTTIRGALRVAAGGQDVQISAADADLTRDAFVKAGNRLVAFKVYPALNHLFAVSKSGGVADYYDSMATVDAAFLNDLARFVVTASTAAPATAPAPVVRAAGRRPAR
jgi:hypothetical protein